MQCCLDGMFEDCLFTN